MGMQGPATVLPIQAPAIAPEGQHAMVQGSRQSSKSESAIAGQNTACERGRKMGHREGANSQSRGGRGEMGPGDQGGATACSASEATLQWEAAGEF